MKKSSQLIDHCHLILVLFFGFVASSLTYGQVNQPASQAQQATGAVGASTAAIDDCHCQNGTRGARVVPSASAARPQSGEHPPAGAAH